MLTDSAQTSTRGLTLSQTVAIASFFLLFPGFLFYHQFLAMGLISPFAGGLFGYVSLGALLVLLALLPWNTDWLKKIIGNRYAQWAVVFLAFVSVWTLIHYLAFDHDYITQASRQSLETIILLSCLFLVGSMLPLESKSLRWSFSISFIIILIFLLYTFASTDTDGYYARRFYGNPTGVASYQGFARSALIILLFLMAVFNSFRSRVLFILGGVFILYLLMSRSDFYAFLVVSLALCVISGIKQPKYFLLLSVIFLEVVILAAPDIMPRIGVFLETRFPDKVVEEPTTPSSGDETAPAPITDQANAQSPPGEAVDRPRVSRQLEVFDLASSKSWLGRQSLQKIAIEQISENPLVGKFGGHVLAESSSSYAHNALSAWVNYGFPGFLIYVSLTLAGFLISAYQLFLKQQDVPLWNFAFMVNFVCLILIVASKSVFWPLPALGWGVVANALTDQSGSQPYRKQAEITQTAIPISGNSKSARAALKRTFSLSP